MWLGYFSICYILQPLLLCVFWIVLVCPFAVWPDLLLYYFPVLVRPLIAWLLCGLLLLVSETVTYLGLVYSFLVRFYTCLLIWFPIILLYQLLVQFWYWTIWVNLGYDPGPIVPCLFIALLLVGYASVVSVLLVMFLSPWYTGTSRYQWGRGVLLLLLPCSCCCSNSCDSGMVLPY
jgi:hypothetical protein